MHDSGTTDNFVKPDEGPVQPTASRESANTPGTEHKRKYRRHPKPDEHAPEKPPSAYVLFSNRVREEIKHENLSFTEIARLVGERWQKLDPKQKEPFETQAANLKDVYSMQLVDYKKTENHREYAAYLAEFKAKHGASESKRPKLDQTGSNASQKDSSEHIPQITHHARGGSIGSMSAGSHGDMVPSMALATSISGNSHLSSDTVVPSHFSTTYLAKSQDRPYFGVFSAGTPVSDELHSRMDTDLVPSAATLSLATSPQHVTSLTATSSPTTRRPDHLTGMDPLWHARTPLSAGSIPTPGATSPTGPSLSHNSFVIPSRVDTARQASMSLPMPNTSSALPLPIYRLLDPDTLSEPGSTSSVARRVLPPPHLSSLDTSVSPGRGTPLTFSNMQQHNMLGTLPGSNLSSQTANERQFPVEPARMDPSETEAAELLARLAARQDSRSSRGQHRPGRPWE